MLEFIYYLALYLGLGWTMAVLVGHLRTQEDLAPGSPEHLLSLFLVTTLWPVFMACCIGYSLFTVLWWVRRRWLP